MWILRIFQQMLESQLEDGMSGSSSSLDPLDPPDPQGPPEKRVGRERREREVMQGPGIPQPPAAPPGRHMSSWILSYLLTNLDQLLTCGLAVVDATLRLLSLCRGGAPHMYRLLFSLQGQLGAAGAQPQAEAEAAAAGPTCDGSAAMVCVCVEGGGGGEGTLRLSTMSTATTYLLLLRHMAR